MEPNRPPTWVVEYDPPFVPVWDRDAEEFYGDDAYPDYEPDREEE